MSSDDILARLSHVVCGLERLSYVVRGIGESWERDVVRDAAAAIRQRDAEIDRLQRWKAESITLLKQWNQIADDVIARLDADETLGLRLPDIVASELDRLTDMRDASLLIISDLQAEVERLRTAGEGLAIVALGVRPWITALAAMVERERIDEALAAWNEARRER